MMKKENEYRLVSQELKIEVVRSIYARAKDIKSFVGKHPEFKYNFISRVVNGKIERFTPEFEKLVNILKEKNEVN